MAVRLPIFVMSVALLALLLPTSPARADQIDGDWCFSDGRHMFIQGPEIVTPAGNQIAGNYRRHSFSYEVPTDEPEAGSTIYMIQLNDDTIHVTAGAEPENVAPAQVQVWHRCSRPAV